jgi:hypothetical protein
MYDIYRLPYIISSYAALVITRLSPCVVTLANGCPHPLVPRESQPPYLRVSADLCEKIPGGTC